MFVRFEAAFDAILAADAFVRVPLTMLLLGFVVSATMDVVSRKIFVLFGRDSRLLRPES